MPVAYEIKVLFIIRKPGIITQRVSVLAYMIITGLCSETTEEDDPEHKKLWHDNIQNNQSDLGINRQNNYRRKHRAGAQFWVTSQRHDQGGHRTQT